MTPHHRRHLLVLAAGAGRRVGESVPKQFLTDRDGVTILQHTLQRALERVRWDSIVVAVPADRCAAARALFVDHVLPPLTVVAGDAQRMNSLRNALESIPDAPDDICVVHDGVRPCTPPAMFSAVVARLRDTSIAACWPASPIRDTVLVSTGPDAWGTSPPGDSMIAATPIAIRRHALGAALSGDVPLSEILISRILEARVTWSTVENSWWNFKVTTAADLAMARELLSARARCALRGDEQ